MAGNTYGTDSTGSSKFERTARSGMDALMQADQAWVEGDYQAARNQVAAAREYVAKLEAMVNKKAGG